MAKVYYNRIMLGYITIDGVPAKLRKQVQALLEENEVDNE